MQEEIDTTEIRILHVWMPSMTRYHQNLHFVEGSCSHGDRANAMKKETKGRKTLKRGKNEYSAFCDILLFSMFVSNYIHACIRLSNKFARFFLIRKFGGKLEGKWCQTDQWCNHRGSLRAVSIARLIFLYRYSRNPWICFRRSCWAN